MSDMKPFAELLNEAPLATSEKTISLTGALARSHEHGKFVLIMGENQNVTLDVDAVRGYKVLSGMVGQLVVQVDVDKDRVPRHAAQESQSEFARTVPWRDQGTISYQDVPHTVPAFDTGWMDFKTPWIDYPVKQIVESTGTIQETIGDPGLGGDPAFFAGQAAGGAAPFALATGHQIPQGAFAGLFGRTTPIWEHRTITYTDKLPITDITGHFPYPD